MHVIDEKLYIKTKAKLSKPKATLSQVKGQTGLSNSSLNRIKKSKDYTDFKRLLVKDRGPQYGVRNEIWTKQDTSTPIVELPKRRSLLDRLRGRR